MMNETRMLDQTTRNETMRRADTRRIPLLDAQRIAFSCRHVPVDQMYGLLSGPFVPESGDLVLARVDRIGQHKALEGVSRRRITLYEGDEIVVAYGARYAMNQFEALVPPRLDSCHLVAAGGVAGMVCSSHQKMARATALTPLGLLADASGQRLNLRDWCALPDRSCSSRPLTIAVLGSTMDAGKTTVCAQLVRGLGRAGWRVGAAKVTGTASPLDFYQLKDAGARTVVDFTDAGLASTYLQPQDLIESVFARLIQAAAGDDNEVVVLEVADGLLQQETAALIRSKVFERAVDGVILAAGDPVCALGGLQLLQTLPTPVIAVSGVLTCAPLAIREAQQVTLVPVIATHDLSDPAVPEVLGLVRRAKTR